MTVRQFISELESIKEELKNKDIVLEAPNELLFTPAVKYKKYPGHKHNFELSDKTVEQVVITWR